MEGVVDEMDRRFTQEKGKASEASSATGGLSLQALGDIQRKTVADHIRYEQNKNWQEMYRTFTPHHEDSY
jgi:hypothetical protein